ncbi:MAG: hypothetical protein ACTHKV_14520, partial [Flavipsychrobacter sp.]
IFLDPYVYIPILIKNSISSGFNICKLNVKTHDLSIISDSYNIVSLDRIEDDKLFFYTDLDKKKLEILFLNKY